MSITKVFKSCRDALTRSIIKMSVKAEDVDDILQETFIQAYSAEKKRKINSPQSYLFTISRNLVIKQAQDRSRAIQAVIDNASAMDIHNNVEEDLDQKEKVNALNEAMKSLPKKNSRAILLRKVYDMSSMEIARTMGVSKSSVDKYIAEGIRHCEYNMKLRGFQNDATVNNSQSIDANSKRVKASSVE